MGNLEEQFEEIIRFAHEQDIDFIAAFNEDLCIDGHFTKEDLIKLANKILDVFEEHPQKRKVSEE